MVAVSPNGSKRIVSIGYKVSEAEFQSTNISYFPSYLLSPALGFSRLHWVENEWAQGDKKMAFLHR